MRATTRQGLCLLSMRVPLMTTAILSVPKVRRLNVLTHGRAGIERAAQFGGYARTKTATVSGSRVAGSILGDVDTVGATLSRPMAYPAYRPTSPLAGDPALNARPQSKRLETLSSREMRRMASPISGAMVTTRMFSASLTAWVGSIESVITSDLRALFLIRSTAAPDRTP